jgi:hypothetical protein
MTRTIYLSGKAHDVNVQRKYKSVWLAVGEWMGRRIEVKERSEEAAVAAWVAAVTAQTATAA